MELCKSWALIYCFCVIYFPSLFLYILGAWIKFVYIIYIEPQDRGKIYTITGKHNLLKLVRLPSHIMHIWYLALMRCDWYLNVYLNWVQATLLHLGYWMATPAPINQPDIGKMCIRQTQCNTNESILDPCVNFPIVNFTWPKLFPYVALFPS